MEKIRKFQESVEPVITAALRDVVIPKEGGAALAKRSVAVGVLIDAMVQPSAFDSDSVYG